MVWVEFIDRVVKVVELVRPRAEQGRRHGVGVRCVERVAGDGEDRLHGGF